MIVNPHQQTDRQRFHMVGRSIRAKFDAHILPFWQDSFNLEQVAQDTNTQLKLIATDKGRLGVFKLSEDLGAIGWYECVDDSKIAEELLEWAMQELRKMGVKSIVGPINGSTWYNYRFNLSSEKPIFTGEPHQPAYYVKQWEAFGFEIGEEYETNVTQLNEQQLPEKVQLVNEITSRGFDIVPFDIELHNKQIEAFYELLISSFKKNKAYKAIGIETYRQISAHYPKVLDKRYSWVIREQERPIGFVGCIKDTFHSFYHEAGVEDQVYAGPKLIIKTLVVHPLFQNQGLAASLVRMAMISAQEDGLTQCLHALMHQSNLSATGGKRIFEAQPKINYALLTLNING